MMKETEFRLGNLCRDKLTGEYLRVSDLTEEGETIVFSVINRDAFPLPDGWNAESIPITPEILEKCGFERDNNGWKLKVSEMMFLWWGEMERTMRMCSSHVDWSYPIYLKAPIYHFQYVHQLQNLYFALTGEELPVKIFNCETCNTPVDKEGTDCDRCAKDGQPEEAQRWNERADPNFE